VADENKKKPRLSLSTGILIGMILGLSCGIFFGEYCGFLQIIGDAFIKLLQMTILPYIVVSLILGIGSLTYQQAKQMVAKAGVLLLLFWAISFAIVLLFPLSFPKWESAAFFSTSLVETPKEVDFLSLYIPSNPFYSLANNIVPAVVLFSILLGVALMGIEEKTALLQGLVAASSALIRVTGIVVKLTPIGVFAITAAAAGTMSVQEFGRLQVYLVSFNLAALLLTFGILPLLVIPVTPFKYKDIVGMSKDALLTAFTTGNLFVVLAVLTHNCKTLFEKYDLKQEKTDTYIDVMVPVSFNFPTTGKLIMLLFIFFAAWFSGRILPFSQYPTFVFSGLLSFFGGVDVAMPFMLDLMQLPADMYQLYVVTGIINGRTASLLAAMNLVVFTILATCALTGVMKFKIKQLMSYTVVSLLLTLAVIGASRAYFSFAVKNVYEKDQIIANMQLLQNPAPARIHREIPENIPKLDPNMSILDRIKASGVLRVGYHADNLPFSYFNIVGELVGFDIDMAHLLAKDLEVNLEFIPFEHDTMLQQLNDHQVDIIMSGVAVTPLLLKHLRFSAPYMDSTLAFIVRDHRRNEFASLEKIAKADGLMIGVPHSRYFLDVLQEVFPKAEIVPVNSVREFFEITTHDIDALLLDAEAGSAWTLLYPDYQPVVPKPNVVRLPRAYPIAGNDPDMANFISQWIELRNRTPYYQTLFQYWILGQGAVEKKPRWSIIRNVLGWVESPE
jgi:Na+/H+-dicarboxylate symporter